MKKYLFASLLILLGCFQVAAVEQDSKIAYEKLLEELKALEHSVSRNSSMEKVIEVFDKIEVKLVEFAEQYPGSNEALEAVFQLGMLNSNINNNEKTRKYLKEYVNSPLSSSRQKIGIAHFFLAEAYKKSEQYGAAKKHYKIYLKDYPDVSSRYMMAAKTTLGDIEVLRQLAIGKPPIPFKVKDMNGKTLSLDKYQGKVVLLDFWATWCGPCRQDMPSVIKLYNKHKRDGFEIIGISLDSKKAALEKYLRDNGIKWPQYFDGEGWENEIAQKYRVRAIPATFLLDRKGNIRYKAVRGRELARAVEKLLRES